MPPAGHNRIYTTLTDTTHLDVHPTRPVVVGNQLKAMSLVNALADDPEIHDVGPALSRMDTVAFDLEFAGVFAEDGHLLEKLRRFDPHAYVDVGE